jgi:hypothetical protein
MSAARHGVAGCTGASCPGAAWGGCPCPCHDAPDDTGDDDPPSGRLEDDEAAE